MRVAGPREDEEAERHEPAGEHHGDQSGFCGRGAVVLLAQRQVVFVDKWCAGRTHQDADAHGDEHKACGAGGEVFAF